MQPVQRPVGIRWTIGNVSDRGFEALRLSILGARRLFGPAASYAVVVNSMAPETARARTGPVPADVAWIAAHGLPDVLKAWLDDGMAEGVAWKLAPLRLWPDRYELSLDNDCILWAMPAALDLWFAAEEPVPCVLEEDVKRALGQFDALCGPRSLNTGIRGLPPGFDLEAALAGMLKRHPVRLESELDEQGLQVAALSLHAPPLVVTVEEVTICSPFWPHQPWLGPCGAHFVGLNARALPWRYYERPATECVIENWTRHKDRVLRQVAA